MRTNVKKTKQPLKLNKGQAERLHALTDILLTRSQYASQLGKTYQGDRDIYTAAGYKNELSFSNYKNRFDRQDIAFRVVTAFPAATWVNPPDIFETEDEDETDFEKEWEKVLDSVNVFSYLCRVDKLAGIGQFAVLVIGFDDQGELSQPVKKATQILFLQPYVQDKIKITEYETDVKSPRYGLPKMYSIDMSIGKEAKSTEDGSRNEAVNTAVHYTRVLHVADNALESDVFGTPRQQVVYNRLEDLDKISAGSAEMFWRGGFQGIAFEMDKDATLTPQAQDDLEDEIENYIHKLTRYIRLQGIEAKPLAVNIADPSSHFDMALQLISGATGIPRRILTGSERGELASSQDKKNWDERVDERRKSFAQPVILEPFIDRLIEVGILPEPKEGYDIKWPDIEALSEKDQADVAKVKTEAICSYVRWGAEMMITPFQYFTKILNMSDEEATAIIDEVEEYLKEVAAEEEEDAKIAAEEEARIAEEQEKEVASKVEEVEQ